jgi:hypothetical protein
VLDYVMVFRMTDNTISDKKLFIEFYAFLFPFLIGNSIKI